jgi:hypothetical protein
MTLQELIRLATHGQISELELLSLEGGFYLVRTQRDGKPVTLLDEQGKPVRLRSSDVPLRTGSACRSR